MEYQPIELPKDICDALHDAQQGFNNTEIMEKSINKEWKLLNFRVLNKITIDILMRALVLGYRYEPSISEQIRALYWNGEECGGDMVAMFTRQNAIFDTLNILGIKYDWMEVIKK